jgi:hypothetical protein
VVAGEITSPEVAHDMSPEDYKFQINQTAGPSSKSTETFRSQKLDKGLIGLLRKKFDEFPKVSFDETIRFD